MSVSVIMPLRVPAAAGMNVTSIEQLAPDATIEPQSSVSPKFVLAVRAVIRKAAVPEFVTVTEIEELVSPTISVPKSNMAVDKISLGAPLPNEVSPPPQAVSGRTRSVSAR